MIVVTDGDGNPITLPVTPPTKICISLSEECRPGTIDIRWDDPFQEPTSVEVGANGESVCFEIPQGTVGLVLSNSCSEDVLVV